MSDKTKPMLFSDERSDAERFNPRKWLATGMDPSEVPGWSERVRANDLAKADDLIFRDQNNGKTKEHFYNIVGATPGELPVDFKWLRVTSPTGTRSGTVTQQLSWYQDKEGFRPATMEDLEKYGYKLPPTAHVSEDNLIRRGSDVALYIRSGEVARMWDEFREEEALREAERTPSGAGLAEDLTFSEKDRPSNLD